MEKYVDISDIRGQTYEPKLVYSVSVLLLLLLLLLLLKNIWYSETFFTLWMAPIEYAVGK